MNKFLAISLVFLGVNVSASDTIRLVDKSNTVTEFLIATKNNIKNAQDNDESNDNSLNQITRQVSFFYRPTNKLETVWGQKDYQLYQDALLNSYTFK